MGSRMSHSFVAYIDEAGDEGFVFKPNGSGSTHWFVLSALVVRKENDRQLVQLARDIRQLLNKPADFVLHARKLKHEKRIPIARKIGEAPVRTVSVLIHKPSMAEPDNFKKAYSLYRYASRLLLERVSWLCKAHHISGQGNGQVDLIFSNRSAMSYDDLRNYLHKLKAGATAQIDWNVIDPARIRAVNHDQLAGLQLADAVATGTFYAVRLSDYVETEPRYLEFMARTLYRHQEKLLGYGLKLWCEDPVERQKIEMLAQRL